MEYKIPEKFEVGLFAYIEKFGSHRIDSYIHAIFSGGLPLSSPLLKNGKHEYFPSDYALASSYIRFLQYAKTRCSLVSDLFENMDTLQLFPTIDYDCMFARENYKKITSLFDINDHPTLSENSYIIEIKDYYVSNIEIYAIDSHETDIFKVDKKDDSILLISKCYNGWKLPRNGKILDRISSNCIGNDSIEIELDTHIIDSIGDLWSIVSYDPYEHYRIDLYV